MKLLRLPGQGRYSRWSNLPGEAWIALPDHQPSGDRLRAEVACYFGNRSQSGPPSAVRPRRMHFRKQGDGTWRAKSRLWRVDCSMTLSPDGQQVHRIEYRNPELSFQATAPERAERADSEGAAH